MNPIEQAARSLGVMKSLRFSGIVLTLYDYMLTFNDEIQYVWRGRKTWIFHLYALNRTVLTALRLWEIYILTGPKNSRTGCIVAFHLQVVMGTFFLFSSDVFIALRVYALTLRNKFIAAYFGTLALTKFGISLASTLGKPVAILDLPPIPIDTFNLCLVIPQFQFRSVAVALATVFDLSAFIVVAWCIFHNMRALKFSMVVRTIITDATIYFLAMVTLQIYSQLSFIFMEGLSRQLSFVAYVFINPVLTMRFVVSLRRVADPDGGQGWRLEHFSSTSPYSNPSSGTRVATNYENIEMNTARPPKNRLKSNGP